jgi:putative multiple sugar transport system substrate-binding protein
MLAASVVTATACLGLGACTPTPSGPPVAVLFPGETDDAWGASADVVRQELADDGYAVEVRLAGDDIPTQLEQLHEVLDAAPIAVVIAPVDATAIAAVLDEEAPPDVAVIAYDDLVLDSARLDYFASFDHRAAGRMQAQALVDALGLSGHLDGPALSVELLAGSGDDRGAQDAFAGALEVLQPYLDAGRLTVPSGRVAFEQAAVLRGDPATAAERVAALLDEGVALAGVLSPSDAMSAAIAEVIAAAGFEIVPPGARWSASPVPPEPSAPSSPAPPPDATTPPNTDAEPDAEPGAQPDLAPDIGTPAVVLTGGGASLDGARAVRDGTQTATVHEDPRELARVVASMVREVARGTAPTVTQGATTDNGIREVPTRLLAPRLVATREDAAKLL